MSTRQSVLGDLLTEIAKAVREMSDDEFEKLVNGELRTSISFTREDDSVKSTKLRSAISDENLRSVHTRLSAAQTREEGYHIVQECFSVKEQLIAFARFLDLPVQKRDRVDKIQEKIVTSTVGRRLGGEAIRGGYSAK